MGSKVAKALRKNFIQTPGSDQPILVAGIPTSNPFVLGAFCHPVTLVGRLARLKLVPLTVPF